MFDSVLNTSMTGYTYNRCISFFMLKFHRPNHDISDSKTTCPFFLLAKKARLCLTSKIFSSSTSPLQQPFRAHLYITHKRQEDATVAKTFQKTFLQRRVIKFIVVQKLWQAINLPLVLWYMFYVEANITLVQFKLTSI